MFGPLWYQADAYDVIFFLILRYQVLLPVFIEDHHPFMLTWNGEESEFRGWYYFPAHPEGGWHLQDGGIMCASHPNFPIRHQSPPDDPFPNAWRMIPYGDAIP